MKFLIRASYPNFYMTSLFAREGRRPFDFDNESPENRLAGNKPGTVIYTNEEDETREFPPRWYDMYYLLKQQGEEKERYLKMLLDEAKGKQIEELERRRDNFRLFF